MKKPFVYAFMIFFLPTTLFCPKRDQKKGSRHELQEFSSKAESSQPESFSQLMHELKKDVVEGNELLFVAAALSIGGLLYIHKNVDDKNSACIIQ